MKKAKDSIKIFFKHFFSASDIHINTMTIYSSIIFVVIIVGYFVLRDINSKMIELFVVTALGGATSSVPTSIIQSLGQKSNNPDQMNQLLEAVGNVVEEHIKTTLTKTQMEVKSKNESESKESEETK